MQLRVSPGEHQLRIEKDGYVTFSRDLEIAKGEEKFVGVQLLRLDAAEPIVGWTPSSEPPTSFLVTA